MQIKKSVYKQMLHAYAPTPPEQGGMLGIENGTVCAYMHDDSPAAADRAVYIPDVVKLNQTLAKWKRKGILFAGLVHSHPAGQNSLSGGDIQYIEAIFARLPKDIVCLYFPLILPDEVICFQFRRCGEKILMQKQPIEIV